MKLLWLAFIREAFKRPWQLVLTMFSVAAGVAVVVGVEVANTSALAEFDRANQTIDGVASHRIVGGLEGLDEDVFRLVKVVAGIRNAAPVVSAAVIAEGTDRRYQLLGIDPLSDFRVRSLSNNLDFTGGGTDSNLPWPLFAINADVSADAENQLILQSGNRVQAFSLLGQSFHSADRKEAEDNILITDISWAQSFLNMHGRISQIELKLESDEQLDLLAAILPSSVRVVDLALFNGARRDMTTAFRVNLTALGLLALVIAMFLIYSSVSFQIVRRRQQIGLLRLAGVTSTQLALVLLAESIAFAFFGVLLGLVLGYILAIGLSALVTGTINALYFSLADSTILFTPLVAAKAALLGVCATLLSSVAPIVMVSRRQPVSLIHASHFNQQLTTLSGWLLPSSSVLFLTGLLLLVLPGLSLTLAFAGLFLLICALAVLTPWVIERICRVGRRITLPGKGLLAKMVVLNIAAHQRRTAVAVAALSVAVSATLGVALMIDSFRFSVEQWLEGYLLSDIYISGETTAASSLSPEFLSELSSIPGVVSLATGTRRNLITSDGPVTLFVLDTNADNFEAFQIIEKTAADLWQAFENEGAVLVSEPFARHNSVQSGQEITIPTDQGVVGVPVAAIYRDYSSDRGLIAMSRTTYTTFFNDSRIMSAALVVNLNTDVEPVIAKIQALESTPKGLYVRSNKNLREASLTVFDQTFRVTEVLRWLAIVVSVIGIISALMALQLERIREYAILKAIGFSHWQLGAQILLETGITGLIAGLMAVPLGLVLAVSLIKVINLRSYGWSMQTIIAPELIFQSIFLAVAAALIAGLYPAWQLWRINISAGLRND